MADIRSVIVGFDLDSGAGVHLVQGVNLRMSASGGSVEAIGQQTMAASLPVTIASNQSALPVSESGTWNITNVSGTVSLPTGASTAAKQPALGTAGSASADVITVQGIASMTALKVDGSAVTQPISAASLPLPTGASTSAKQPALGTAGSASADVITVQGITSMTALKVDGSAVTQPVSAASLPLPAGAATSAKQPALGTAGAASADVITVQGVSGGTAIPVSGALSSPSATSPVNTYVTSAAVAAGASVNLDTGDLISAGIVKLASLEVWASVAFKAFVYSIANGVASTNPIAVGGGIAGMTFRWWPPQPNYTQLSNSAGVDGYRVAFTNLDDLSAADAFAVFHTES